jgi:3-keto-disaccharide hydrolase
MNMHRILLITAFCAAAAVTAAQNLSLDSAAGLVLHNVQAESVKLDGKRGLRVTFSAEAGQRFRGLTPEQQAQFETLAVIEGSDFSNGVIEAEIAGEPAADAPEGARGFVGIAFRVRPDLRTYDAFYLRPTNGRADDQVRRNHSVQYISQPDWPWPRLRKESPERYESYVDLEPGKWTRVRIEVQGDRARLFVHGQSQPTLIVNDLKTGASGRGAIALWTNPGTVAHFRDLRISAN